MVHHSGPGFVMVGAALVDAGVSGTATKVALILGMHGKCIGNDGVYADCWPSADTVAKRIGVSTRTVIRALKELVKAGVITGKARHAPGGAQLTTSYTVALYLSGSADATSQASDGGATDAADGASQMQGGDDTSVMGGDDTSVTQPITRSYPEPMNQKNPPTPRRTRKVAPPAAPVVVGSTNLAKAVDLTASIGDEGVDRQRLVPHVCDALDRGIDANALAASLTSNLPDVVHDMTSLLVYRARSARPGRSVGRAGWRSGTGPIPAHGRIEDMFADYDAGGAGPAGQGQADHPVDAMFADYDAGGAGPAGQGQADHPVDAMFADYDADGAGPAGQGQADHPVDAMFADYDADGAGAPVDETPVWCAESAAAAFSMPVA